MLEEVKFLIVVALKILNVESDKNIENPRNKGEKLQSRYSSQFNDLNACLVCLQMDFENHYSDMWSWDRGLDIQPDCRCGPIYTR